jgi:hypothetical protein
VREFGTTSSRLGPRIPFNAVMSMKMCEQGKGCPDDLVAQVSCAYIAARARVTRYRASQVSRVTDALSYATPSLCIVAHLCQAADKISQLMG